MAHPFFINMLTSLKGSQFYLLLLQLVLCRVVAHRHSADYIFLYIAIVQIIFSFWSFEISEDILRNQKLIIGKGSFSYQHFIYFGSVWIILVFVLTILLKVAILQYFTC